MRVEDNKNWEYVLIKPFDRRNDAIKVRKPWRSALSKTLVPAAVQTPNTVMHTDEEVKQFIEALQEAYKMTMILDAEFKLKEGL